MDDVVRDLEGQLAELDAVLTALDDAAWAQPSRCPGWSVADVVTHLVQSDLLALASLSGGFTGGSVGDVDAWAAEGVAAAVDLPPADSLDLLRTVSADLVDALASDDGGRRVPWVAGSLSVRTLAATRLSETWIHTNDIATTQPTDRLRHVARLAWRTLPYAFDRAGRELHGPVAFRLIAPSGAEWRFEPDEPAITLIEGPGAELCEVAAQRRTPQNTSLTATGTDADGVLQVVRTFA